MFAPVALLLVVAPAPVPKDGKLRAELARLEGEWRLERVEAVTPKSRMTATFTTQPGSAFVRWTFEGAVLTSERGVVGGRREVAERVRFALDPRSAPNCLRVTRKLTDDGEEDDDRRQRYEFAGGTLKVAFDGATPRELPASFDLGAGAERHRCVLTFKRVKEE